MSKRRVAGKLLGVALIALLTTAGSSAAANKAPQLERRSPNAAMREIAQGLAALLGDAQVRRTVKEQVGKKFDGDFDLLYRDVANHQVGQGQTFRQALVSAVGQVRKSEGKLAGRGSVLRDLDVFVSSLPQLQISIPVGFKDWNEEKYAPLVAFVPVDVDDVDLREVEAFDVAGRRHLLDAWIEPDFPVVVVGLNERTDRNGYLRPEFVRPAPGGVAGESTPPTSSFSPKIACNSSTHSSGDQEFLNEIKINNDHEPWTSGSPEIYATYSFPDNQGIRGQFFMSNVDNEGQWYSISGPLFYWHSYYGNTFAMGIMEQDGSDFGTLSLSFGGLKYTLNIHNGDDSLGSTVVSFLDPNCGYYSTGDADFKMAYQGTGGACGEASCVPSQGTYISHFTGAGCTGTESYYLPYDGYGYSCRTWNGTGQCGTIHRTVTNRSYRYNGTCYDAWPSGNTLTDFVTIYR
jgi:DUF3103 family protein